MNDYAEIKISFSDSGELNPLCSFHTRINIFRTTPANAAFSIICRNPDEIFFSCNGVNLSPANTSRNTSDFISERIYAELKSGLNTIEYSHQLFIQKRTAGSFVFGKSKEILTAFAELKQIKSVFENRDFSMSIESSADIKSSFIKDLFLSPFIIFYGGKNIGEERGVNYKSKTKRKNNALHSDLKFGIDFPDRISVSIGRRKLFR
ncbi:MAG TPA: hypothetical protein PLH15_09645 [Spirochaetota bacterium]|nr:hypothetical protein [Spirochaetota bacterium]